MVAEAQVMPVKRKKGERGPSIPVLTRLQARNLYLHECLPTKLIAERTGLPVGTLHSMFQKEGWTKLRREMEARLISKQDARGDEIRAQAEEAIAARATAIAAKALTVTEAGLDQGDLDGAKQAQAASSALKNLVTSARVLQTQPGSAVESGPTNFNLFFVGQPMGQGQGEPKHVTEVTAKTVQ